MRLSTLVLTISLAVILGLASWAMILGFEQRALLKSLHDTEALLAAERRGAERLERNHAQELQSVRARADEDRRLLIENHDKAIRAIAAEAIGMQVALVQAGWDPHKWPPEKVLRFWSNLRAR